MDVQVQAVQQWLNDTYGSASGWVTLTEDGVSGLLPSVDKVRQDLGLGKGEVDVDVVQLGCGSSTGRGSRHPKRMSSRPSSSWSTASMPVL